MTTDQMTFQLQQGSTGAIATIATSLGQVEAGRWLQLLEPFLQVGRPLGRGYLDFGARAAVIRWAGDSGLPVTWKYAHALVGERTGLIASQALELPELDPADLPSGGIIPVDVSALGLRHDAIASLARSAEARPVLIPLLAHVLWGERRIVMPWQEPVLPEAVLWGLACILEIIRDTQPLSFLTFASGFIGPDAMPGAFVSFQPASGPVGPGSRVLAVATLLVDRFADSPDQLRQEVAQRGIDAAEDRHVKIKRLLRLLPTTHRRGAGGGRA